MKFAAIFEEFKTFISRGNVIDLAVGVVIGGAFSRLVEGVVKGVIEPIANLVIGQGSWQLVFLGLVSLGSVFMNFLLLAAVVFFIFVKPMNALKRLSARKEEASSPPKPPTSEELLTEIWLEEVGELLIQREPLLEVAVDGEGLDFGAGDAGDQLGLAGVIEDAFQANGFLQ
ncbi:MAG: large conductance mechanosensitive channel protein MscL, partial [Verrucomicrobiia bacterium]